MLSRRLLSLVLMVGLLFATTGGALAQDGGPGSPQVGESVTALAGTGFTYQGELKNGGSPVNGTCDFQFSLFDAAVSGTQLGSTQTVTGVTVADGRFTVTINSGNQFNVLAFNGSARYLALAVRCPAGSGGYTSLTPRQPLTPAPLALALPGLRTEQNATSPNVIGGHVNNTVSGGIYGATIGGGGSAANPNQITGTYGVIGGGLYNVAGSQAFIGGGVNNTAGELSAIGGGYLNTANGYTAFIGGGEENHASASFAVVGGGYNNTASANTATVGGGQFNSAGALQSTIGGGYQNTVNGAGYGTVSGGYQNTASQYGAVGGGRQNLATGFAATIAGGYGNIASGDFSFAGGADARAIHNGSFVWANQLAIPISSTAIGQFLVRATGGISMTTNAAGTTGCNISAGGGTWTCTSDRNAKANFAAVDNVAVLNALMSIPIQTWNFNTQDAAIQHMGPMAQDFYAAYGLGEGELTISAVDADGVALAAIQGLYTVVQQKDAQISALEASNAALQAEQTALDARLAALEQGGPGAPAPTSNLLQLLVVLVLGVAVGGGLTLGAFMLGKRQTAKA